MKAFCIFMAGSEGSFVDEHCFAWKGQYLYYKISLLIRDISHQMKDAIYPL
jgi:hypothetical protein